MSGAIHSDHYILAPAVMLEMQLHAMRIELEQIKSATARPADFPMIRDQRQQLREIARLAAETVQAVNMREVR